MSIAREIKYKKTENNKKYPAFDVFFQPMQLSFKDSRVSRIKEIQFQKFLLLHQDGLLLLH